MDCAIPIARRVLPVLVIGSAILAESSLVAFKTSVHIDITSEVLSAITRTINGETLRFHPDAIEEIVRANIDQDGGAIAPCVLSLGFVDPGGAFAVSANHFDGEQLNEGSVLAIDRLTRARAELKRSIPDGAAARRFLGQVLHAVQDYYAHSNWVDGSLSGPDNRLGVLPITDVASPGVPTCEAPPQTGTYVSFPGLTSGYWFGCSGRDDSLLPPGKCYHGFELGVWPYHGTNKDHDDRINFPQARQSAKETTQDIVDRLLNTNGIAENRNRVAALMGYRTLAFVVDHTGSMGEELPLVKQSIRETVQAAAASGDKPGFVLVPFTDEVGNTFVSTDSSAFLAVVDSLTLADGWECPEASGRATLTAVKMSVHGSVVYTFTDASARDSQHGHDAKVRAKDSGIKIIPKVTGSCSPVDPLYNEMATDTGGQLFVIQPTELASLTPLTIPELSGDLQPLLLANGVLSSAVRSFAVAVDTTVRRVAFAVSAMTSVSVSVKRPDGTSVSAGSPGVTLQSYSSGTFVIVETPAPGTWTVDVAGTGEYSIAVHGNSPLVLQRFALVDYLDVKHPGFYDVEGEPFASQPATALGVVRGTGSAITFYAVSLEGDMIGALPLTLGHLDASSGEYTGTFTLPTVPFRVIARGVEAGVAFQRFSPTVFRPQPVRVFKHAVPDLTPGSQATASFLVFNAGPPTTFDIAARDDRGFVIGVSPQTLTLTQDGAGVVQVTLLAPAGNPATGSPSTNVQLTVSASVQGQPSLSNTAIADVHVKSVPPPAEAIYYLHQENSTLTFGALQLKAMAPDSPTLIKTSGNMKGLSPRTVSFGSWETQNGVPGLEGEVPVGSVVTVKLWMRKSSNYGTVFPSATMKVNDAWGAFFCQAMGTLPLDTTLREYTFSCQTSQPITMSAADRLIVFPGYSMTAGPGNRSMEINMHIEGTTPSRFTMPNPR